MKKLFAFLSVFATPAVLQGAIHDVNLSDAVKNRVVKMTATNFLGGYTGRCVRLVITNVKKDSLNLTVNLGVILKPDDPACQPMVLTGEEKIVVGPGKKEEIDVQIFCGNAPKHCPAKNLNYTYLRLGSDTLISVLRFIKDHSLFDYLGQSAVWTITNYHSVSGVYDPGRDSLSKKLINVICAVTGRAKPDYYTLTAKNETPGAVAYTPKTLKIIAQFEVALKTPTILTVGVFDVRGFLIETIIDRRLFARGAHRIDANFDAEAYGAGNYAIRLMNAERTSQEKKVTAEE